MTFALGEQSVEAKLQWEAAKETIQTLKSRKAGIINRISHYHKEYSLDFFRNLEAAPDATSLLHELDAKIYRARRSAEIIKLPVPNQINIPSFKVAGFFDILSKSLKNILKEAECKVREHVVGLKHDQAESWVSTGQDLYNGDTCPFCAQKTIGLDLIESYAIYFNEEYKKTSKAYC